jgi:hypothetical protein
MDVFPQRRLGLKYMAKNHRQNSNFQIAYFLAGACHTADGAYALLLDLKEDRELALKNYEVQQIKTRAKELRANKKMTSNDESERLDGESELLEIKNEREHGKVLYENGLAEVEFIDKCIAEIQPQRKYKDYPDAEANELAQQEEWKLELIHRAENYLLTMGTIPADHFVTMRMHPEFKNAIMPKINEIKMIISSGIEDDVLKLLEKPKLLLN